jgi:hypothetical protein
MVTVLAIAGVAMALQPPWAPRDSPTVIGATSLVEVPMATHVVAVHPTVVSGTEMLIDGTPETRVFGAAAGVPHDARIRATPTPITPTHVHERTLAITRLMFSLSSRRQLSQR